MVLAAGGWRLAAKAEAASRVGGKASGGGTHERRPVEASVAPSCNALRAASEMFSSALASAMQRRDAASGLSGGQLILEHAGSLFRGPRVVDPLASKEHRMLFHSCIGLLPVEPGNCVRLWRS